MGAGRKPKPPEEKQGRSVSVNFTEAEHAEISRAADAAGSPLSGYIRRLVLRHLARRRR